jgi:hypothetical protein
MAERLTREFVSAKAIIHDTPAMRQPTATDRSFELPVALYAGTVGAYLAFIGIMALGFGNPELVLPLAVCVVFVAMLAGVNAMWMRMKPEHPQRLTNWNRFQRDGVMTAYGRCTANAATVQVLILPVLIVAWGIAVVTIAAVVR